MRKTNGLPNQILTKKDMYFLAFALIIMSVTSGYTKDKFKDGYQFFLSFLSILLIYIFYLRTQCLILLNFKRNPTQLNNSLKYVVYAMILISGSAPFLYLWGMRHVISQLKW
jgi:hypothetical protein